MSRLSSGAVAGALAVSLVVTSACAAPPNREIEDANTALKAAKAAGADRYAAGSYHEAEEAYRLANLAVSGGDYRLALSKALESREHARDAEREAADIHARARDEVLLMMTDVAAQLAHASTELESAERRHVPRATLRGAQQTLAGVEADVQKARAAIQKQDFADAKGTLTSVKARLDKVLASLAGSRPVPPAGRTQS
jgi:hypothetical protein